MLEKVIEQGIKQTTELQEIHHSEVEDLHKQVILKNSFSLPQNIDITLYSLNIYI